MQIKVSPPQEMQAPSQSPSPTQSLQRSQPVSVPYQQASSPKENPFSRSALAAKKAAAVSQVREERNVPEPTKATEPPKEPSDVVRPESSGNDASSSSHPTGAPPSDSGAHLASEWIARERAIVEAETKLKASSTEAEKRAAKAQADEAKAAKALAELEAAKHEPMEFLAKIGMSKEEWEEFVAGGGKMTAQAKRLRAIEAKYSEMEERYNTLEAKARESEAKRAYEAENAAFAKDLGSYVFISKIGGVQSVRDKQAAVAQAEGRQISMKQAADLVEAEIKSSLGPLLKHKDVRATLNLDERDQPGQSAQPAAKTLNGAEGGKDPGQAKEEDLPGPTDWAAKKRKAFKLIEAAQKARGVL